MAVPTWARARARAGPHPACVRAHVQVGARKHRFLKSAEHIHAHVYVHSYSLYTNECVEALSIACPPDSD